MTVGFGDQVFSYQCSPLSRAADIQRQFDLAVSYGRNSVATVVLVLDEVGLAEHSPDMPLKVLHGMLTKPEIAIVGISNWTLDAAKMNRAVCLLRPDPSEPDLLHTGQVAEDNACGLRLLELECPPKAMCAELESAGISETQ